MRAVLILLVLASLFIAQPLGAQKWIKNPTNGYSYAVTKRMTWKNAEAQAVKWGGHLATIRSKSENDWLYKQFSIHAQNQFDGLWIGLTDGKVEGKWVWVSGEKFSYTNWAGGEPNNGSGGGEDFGMMWGPKHMGKCQLPKAVCPGMWNDAPNSPSWQSTMSGIVEMLPLTADTIELSASRGGTVNFLLRAPKQHERKLYLLLGTMSGTFPGVKLSPVVLPLNPDSYFYYTVTDPGGLIQRSLGILDIKGKASATLVLPPGLSSPFIGKIMHHAYAVMNLIPFSFDFASNPVPLKLVK